MTSTSTTVYVVAQLRFTDRASYDRYARGFIAVLNEFGGTLLAADEHPEVWEGTPEWEKVVLLSFPSRPALVAWATSPAYRRISRHRTAGAEACVVSVRGL